MSEVIFGSNETEYDFEMLSPVDFYLKMDKNGWVEANYAWHDICMVWGMKNNRWRYWYV